ncbi:hypothetical protein HKCCE3408_13950 [Rhodobacterales bacterium HKCCE3408]|nr:hypothetical protein [Rhodobacterales bacterium HKCCE3408]
MNGSRSGRGRSCAASAATRVAIVADPSGAAVLHRLAHDLGASARAIRDLPGWLAADLAAAGTPVPPDAARILAMLADHGERLSGLSADLGDYLAAGVQPAIARIEPGAVFAEMADARGQERAAAQIGPGHIRMARADLERVFRLALGPRDGVAAGRVMGALLPSGGWRLTVDDRPAIPALALAALDRIARRYDGRAEATATGLRVTLNRV